jgi:hypothetical protein
MMSDIQYEYHTNPEKLSYDDLTLIDEWHKEMSKLMGVPMNLLTPILTGGAYYPITNHSKFDEDVEINSGLQKFSNTPSILNMIHTFIEDEVEVFSSQLRHVRKTSNGHVLDPWKRSLFIHSEKYNIGDGMIKHETRLGQNGTDYLLLWIIETSLNKEKKILLIWEEVFVTHSTKPKQKKFFEQLNPKLAITSSLYSL